MTSLVWGYHTLILWFLPYPFLWFLRNANGRDLSLFWLYLREDHLLWNQDHGKTRLPIKQWDKNFSNQRQILFNASAKWLTGLNPLNLYVPLIKVSQSCMPNLSRNTVLSLLGNISSFIAIDTSSSSLTLFNGSFVTTFLPSCMKVAVFLDALIAAPGFQLNL